MIEEAIMPKLYHVDTKNVIFYICLLPRRIILMLLRLSYNDILNFLFYHLFKSIYLFATKKTFIYLNLK